MLDVTNKLTGHLSSLLRIIIFAANIPATAYIMKGWVDPESYALIRCGGGVVVFWILSLFVKPQRVEKKKDYLIFALSGIIGLTLFYYIYAWGLGNTSPIDASIILTLPPVMVLILSVFVFREKLTGMKITGLCFGLGGALLVILMQGHAGGHAGFLGNMAVLLCALIFGAYLVYTKDVSVRYNPIILLRWFYLFAFIVALPLFFDNLMHCKLVLHPDKTAIWVILFIATLPTSFAYLLISLAMKSLSSSVISIYNYGVPIIASVMAIMLHQATLRWDEPVAALLVFAGVYLVNRTKSNKLNPSSFKTNKN